MRRDSVGSYLVWLVLVNKTWFADIKYTLGCSSCLGEGEKERRTEEGGRGGEGEFSEMPTGELEKCGADFVDEAPTLIDSDTLSPEEAFGL